MVIAHQYLRARTVARVGYLTTMKLLNFDICVSTLKSEAALYFLGSVAHTAALTNDVSMAGSPSMTNFNDTP